LEIGPTPVIQEEGDDLGGESRVGVGWGKLGRRAKLGGGKRSSKARNWARADQS